MSRDDDDEGAFGGDRGFLVGRNAVLQDWIFKKENADFAPLVNRLRVKKWARENPEKRKAIANRYAAKSDVRAHQLGLAKQRRRERGDARVLTCQEPSCGVQFCRMPGSRRGQQPRFCSVPCYSKFCAATKRTTCACGRPMSGKRPTCRFCAQVARRAREAA